MLSYPMIQCSTTSVTLEASSHDSIFYNATGSYRFPSSSYLSTAYGNVNANANATPPRRQPKIAKVIAGPPASGPVQSAAAHKPCTPTPRPDAPSSVPHVCTCYCRIPHAARSSATPFTVQHRRTGLQSPEKKNHTFGLNLGKNGPGTHAARQTPPVLVPPGGGSHSVPPVLSNGFR
jgi:hypothetical protein